MGKGSGVTFLAKSSVSYGPAALCSGCWDLGPRLQPQRQQGSPAQSREWSFPCVSKVYGKAVLTVLEWATALPQLTEAESPAAYGPACSVGCGAPVLAEQHIFDASNPSMLSCVRGLSCRESEPSVRRLLHLLCSHPLGPSLLPSLGGQACAAPLGVLFLMLL